MLEDAIELIVAIFLIAVLASVLGPIALDSIRDAFGFWGMVIAIILSSIVGLAALYGYLFNGGSG